MTEPRIEKLFGTGAAFKFKFKRADVAREIAEYFGDDIVDSSHDIRAGRVLKEGVVRGVIEKVGAGRYKLSGAKEEELKPCPFCKNPIIGFSEHKTVYGNKWSFADCPSCGCRGPFGLSREDGIKKWNDLQRVP